jgi:multidrug resistance protein, MATE family
MSSDEDKQISPEDHLIEDKK